MIPRGKHPCGRPGSVLLDLDQSFVQKTFEDQEDFLFTHGANLEDGADIPLSVDS
jgi:hypothetical protein